MVGEEEGTYRSGLRYPNMVLKYLEELMIDEILLDAEERMEKSLNSLDSAFNKIRTGRAHPVFLIMSLLIITVTTRQSNKLSNVTVEDCRSLLITPWEKNMLGQ